MYKYNAIEILLNVLFKEFLKPSFFQILMAIYVFLQYTLPEQRLMQMNTLSLFLFSFFLFFSIRQNGQREIRDMHRLPAIE